MFTLCLSALLFAAPIPKTTNEGTIAVLLSGEKSELLLLEPNGKEIKRVDLSDLNGWLRSARLFQNGKRAIVKVDSWKVEDEVEHLGKLVLVPESVYLLTLDGSEKPKEIFNRKYYVECIPSRDGTKLFVSELDRDKMIKTNSEDELYKSWVQDLKTGKVEPVPIPSEYCFVDIGADDSTMLLSGTVDGVVKSAVASTTKWKISPTEGIPSSVHGSIRNGELAYNLKVTQVDNSPKAECFIHNFKTGTDNKMNFPEGTLPMMMTFDKEGKRYAFFDFTEESTPKVSITTYRVFICDTNSNNHKIIFKTSKQKIRWLDWR